MLSAKDRIKNFWQWFSENNAEIERLVNEKRQKDAVELISSQMENLELPSQILLGKSNDRYELTFTPEGSGTIKMLSRAWRESAPQELSEKWDFLTFKKATNEKFSIVMNGKTISSDKLLFGYEVKENKFDIDVFSKGFKRLSNEEMYSLTYLMLDNIFGEEFVEMRFGEINAVKKKKDIEKKKCNCKKMKKIADKCEKKFKFAPMGDPYDTWSLFKSAKEPKKGINNDLVTSVTTINETVTMPENTAQEAVEYGARYCGFALDSEGKDSKIALSERDAFAEKLELLLTEKKLGYIVGFGAGTEHTYVTAFVLDDGALAAYLSDICSFAEKVELYFL